MRGLLVWVAVGCGGRPANNVEHCGSIGGDEVWRAGTHLVSCDVVVAGAVTVEAGAEVLFTSGSSIEVASGGAFEVDGAEGAEVVLRGETESPSAWEGLFYRAGATGRLAHAVLKHAGLSNGVDRSAALTLEGATVAIDGLVIEQNGGIGVALRAGGGFAPDPGGLTVTANGGAVAAEGAGAGTLPADAALTGNLVDEIEVYGTVSVSSAWPAFAEVPYRATAPILVEGPTTPVLTLSPGLTLAFDATSLSVGVGGPGGLGAVGTEEAPIVLTGVDAVPGAWGGLRLDSQTSGALTTLRYIDVGFGGADGAGITIVSTSPTVDEATIHDNLGCGILLEGSGANPTFGAVFYANNADGDLCD